MPSAGNSLQKTNSTSPWQRAKVRRGKVMAVDVPNLSIAWWREPTKDQWLAWVAAWFGWMLDAFDYTVFLFVMVAIAKEFSVSVPAVATDAEIGGVEVS
jgi:hypothetical protein